MFFLRILSIFTGSSSLPLIIGTLVALVVGFFGWLAYHDYKVKEQATIEFNNQQLKIIEEKRQEFQAATDDLSKSADIINNQVVKDNKKIEETNNNIEKQVLSQTNGDNKSSEYLKHLMKELNSIYGEKK